MSSVFTRCSARFMLALAAVLSGCAASPPTPDWQISAQVSLQRALQAYLEGNDRVAKAELDRARREVSSTARADWMGRVELAYCAARLAGLDMQPCETFERLAEDSTGQEQAYARYLLGQPLADDVPLLPEAHRALASQLLALAADTPAVAAGVSGQAAPSRWHAMLGQMKEPLSRLVAAGVLLRAGQADASVQALAQETASAQGWRRAVLAWLQVLENEARRTGDEALAARVRRAMDRAAPR